MKEYLFTEFISRQWNEFNIMLFSGFCTGFLYRITRKYIILKITPGVFPVILELLFFLTAALFTGGVIDCCCRSRLTPYMAVGFVLGVSAAKFFIRR